MSSFTDLLGPSLVQKASSKVRRFDTLQTADVVKGNVVGLLFAAEWSEESARFCERLAQTHREVTEAGGSFTLVLVSSDRDVDAFVRTLAAGPWCALPYTDKLKSRVDALSKRFKTGPVPALVILGPDGNVINKAAKDQVLLSNSAERFPWPPPSVEEALGDVFMNQHGDRVRLRGSLLGGSHLVLFFASPGSGACRALAPALAEAQLRARSEDGAGLEVVYVPASPHDANLAGPEAVLRLSPGAQWLTFPSDSPGEAAGRATALRRIFDVDPSALPRIVLLDSSLATVNPDCVRLVASGARFPWRPRLVWDADEKGGWDADPGAPGAATLILLAERAGALWDKLDGVLEEVAAESAASGSAGGEATAAAAAAGEGPVRRKYFMCAKETHGLGRAVRRLAKLPEAGSAPLAVILELQDRGAFYVLPAGQNAADPAVLRRFLADHAQGALQRCGGNAVQTITVAAALSNPSVVDLFGGVDDVSPLEQCVQCILCPITCPLLCCFRCCMGCCLLTFLGGAMGAAAMGGAGEGRTSADYGRRRED